MAVLHPQHDQLLDEVRSWFHSPFQEMGYSAEQRGWGTYWNNNQIYIENLEPGAVETFLDDAGQYFRPRPVILIIDDLALDALLGPALLAAGCSRDENEIFLAHAGPIHEQVVIPGLLVKPVSKQNLTEFSVTKLKAFAESEDRPDEVRLVAEIIRRREEMTGSGRGLLALLDGVPGAMLWSHDDGQDVWINLLATRVPCRGLGLATALLQHCLAESYANGRRSVIINVKTKNQAAIRLYNRLGFTDEIYRRRQYLLDR